MKKETLFDAIAPFIGINRWTNRLMYCNDAGDDYNDVDCADCLFCSFCCIVPDETLNLMKILYLKDLWNSKEKTEILNYAKVHVGVKIDSENDIELFDCYETGCATCTNCKFNEGIPWCSHKEKEKFFSQFE